MASFLSGLMGGLKQAGSNLGAGLSKVGSGLMGAIDPAIAGTSDITAKGGGPFLAYADPNLDDPITRQLGVSEMRRMPQLEQTPQKPFLKRINEIDPTTGMSTVDKWDRFGARLGDISDGGDRARDVDQRAAGQLSRAARQALADQITALFPNDPKMQFLLKANPEKATEAMASLYQKEREPYTLSKGQQRGVNGELIDYVPDYGVDGDRAWAADPEGFHWGPQRGLSHSEEETGRHNRQSEEVARGALDVSRGNLGVAQGGLGLSRERLNFDRFKDGRDAPGGANGGLGAMTTEQLIAALRGGQ